MGGCVERGRIQCEKLFFTNVVWFNEFKATGNFFPHLSQADSTPFYDVKRGLIEPDNCTNIQLNFYKAARVRPIRLLTFGK
uniref:Uncharacterized protein n=1 Tax=Octopus bimaculoides TaxID=37653 RepID=A0A0L8GDG2_OCTBM